MAPCWFTYMVECRDGALYVGITTDLTRRLAMHNRGVASRYTRVRRPVRYRFAETHGSRAEASKREYELKRWRRAQKLALLASAGNRLDALLATTPHATPRKAAP
jgi:putative endonuclease